jgi:SNF2 family DNA or RNA helicase
LQAELRDYQHQGLDWLMFLHKHQFGGILADDMGLGKTLQTLAFIQKLKSTRKLPNGALVVATTSLLWNWRAEAEKFTPKLNVLVLHGSERHSDYQHLGDYDLVLTTYGLAHRDLAQLKQCQFDCLILDEAQHIKNKDAKTARAVRHIPADMRLCLSGTPLENHLGELWSLMDFALPGLLGNHDHFTRHTRKPIERDNDEVQSAALAKRVAPFMLRRNKEEVAAELTEKTEITQLLELEGPQRRLYESIRVSMEKKVRALIQQKGVAKSHIEFLDALMKLRQACIAPQLVKLPQAQKVKHSAKLLWLENNLPELVEDGRRILIFSQFTQMLALIEDQLNEQGISYLKLTGRTKKRQPLIEAFQRCEVPIFLISLKAGGAGLNLTAADTVIHVDPWWNPAVENQATDRAHRIGQDKPVFVYKLIAKGSVEEKIQQLQSHKQSLADNLFDQTKKRKLPTSADELMSLLQ